MTTLEIATLRSTIQFKQQRKKIDTYLSFLLTWHANTSYQRGSESAAPCEMTASAPGVFLLQYSPVRPTHFTHPILSLPVVLVLGPWLRSVCSTRHTVRGSPAAAPLPRRLGPPPPRAPTGACLPRGSPVRCRLSPGMSRRHGHCGAAAQRRRTGSMCPFAVGSEGMECRGGERATVRE